MLLAASARPAPALATPFTFESSSSLAIPALGAATPFPSTITVAGMTATVIHVTVTLRKYSHSCPNDVDVLLVGPSGLGVLLMSDMGTGQTCLAATGATLTFDDDAATTAPYPPATGTYRPTVNTPGAGSDSSEDFAGAGGPAGPYYTELSNFNGVDPNGVWSLYVLDEQPGDGGSIADGWSLTLEDDTIAGYESTPAPGSEIDLGAALVGTATGASLSVSEAGTAALTITSAVLSGPDAGDFSVTPPTLTIPVGGAAQDLLITCTPSAGGTRTATLTVNHNALGSPATYPLACTGLATRVMLPIVGAGE